MSTQNNFTFKKAERKKAKVPILIGGPAGSGKSYSALRLATGIIRKAGGRIAVIGTEGFRNEYYSDEFDYDVLNLYPPYSPEKYIQAIKAAEEAGYQVCIIDSSTHEWHGIGGILDIKDNMPEKNDYAKWKKLTPRHTAFIETIIRSSMHIILTARGKDQYVQELNENGKPAPKKIGMGIDQRDGLEYECTLAFMLDMDHKATVQKDNTKIFDGLYVMLTEEHGGMIYDWAEKGVSFVTPKAESLPTDDEINQAIIKCGYNDTQEKGIRDHFTKVKKDPVKYASSLTALKALSDIITRTSDLVRTLPEAEQDEWLIKMQSCEKKLLPFNALYESLDKHIKDKKNNSKIITLAKVEKIFTEQPAQQEQADQDEQFTEPDLF